MGPQGGDKLAIFHHIGYILITAIGLGLAIFIHELGHLLTAKWLKVRVERFSIGFGARLFGFTRGGTEYRLSAVPLGGYVKLAGETPHDDVVDDDPNMFLNKKPGVRAVVLVAGATMNFILGIVLFGLAFRLGYPIGLPEIGGVEPGGPAQVAGMQKGDVVTSINDRSPIDFEDLHMAQVLSRPDRPVLVTVRRPGVPEPVHLEVIPHKSDDEPYPSWGVTPAYTMTVADVPPGSRMAEEKLILPGDTIKSVGGQTVSDWSDFTAIMAASPGGEIPVEVERDGRVVATRVTVGTYKEYELGAESASGMIVKHVGWGTPADRAGMRKDDEIVGIGDREIRSWDQLRDALDANGDRPTTVTLLRGGDENPRTVDLTPVKRAFNLSEAPAQFSQYMIGISGEFRPVVGKVVEGSSAWEAGLRPGDRLVSLTAPRKKNGKPVTTPIDDFRWGFVFPARAYLNRGLAVSVRWERNGQEHSGEVLPGEYVALARIGLFPKKPLMNQEITGLAPVRFALRKSFYMVVVLARSMQSMARGWINPKKSLAGPIGILQISYQLAKRGIVHAMYFFGLININLAFINLLPIPILDGGQIVLVGVEKLRGRRLSPRAVGIAQYVGLAIILALLVFALYADLSRLFS